MLVPVEYKEFHKWVRVSKKEDVYDYSEFITENERPSSSESSFCSEDSASSGSTLILESTKARRWQLIHGPVDLTTEHYYDPQSGSGYLAWRLKTVQRNSASEGKSGSTSSYKGGPKTHREMPVCREQLSGDEYKEAMSLMNHSAVKTVVKDKMKATFKHRQKLVHDPEKTSVILDLFPRFLTTSLVAQDFTLLFGEEVSGRFLAIFKPKIIADCKTIPSNSHVDDLLALALQESDHGWHIDLACILLLFHLLPPTSKGKKMGKISASEAEDRLVKFMRKNSIHNYYIILDQKAVPCEAQTAVAAFDELFKAHFVFAVSNFFTFIQTTVYGIDVGKAKESPRVKEIRVRLLRRDL
ncbi:hypothetical protein SRHO_G00318540 [Serrasalmus rhombeus]